MLAAAILSLTGLIGLMGGPAAAVAVGAPLLAALCLTLWVERRGDPSRDAATGLPDRGAAIACLDEILKQRLAWSSQAVVIVISLESGEESGTPLSEEALVFHAAARLGRGLRKGDQIVRVSRTALGAILGPSRGLTAQAAESILGRVEGMFREPVRLGRDTVTPRVALGACLQHDAPHADATSWLQAAELAAEIAREVSAPQLFPSGAVAVDRAAWLASPPLDPSDEEQALWRSAATASAASAAKAGSRRA